MWGCIINSSWSHLSNSVPSLYVRVYRNPLPVCRNSRSSLIICEGVSWKLWKNICRSSFPHYMWGCIMRQMTRMHNRRVPSLYVRVYHRLNNCRKKETGSLIICEGVSWTITRARASRKFPHYTWGCIGAAIFHRTPAAVPSLYVRVYRWHRQ